MESSNCEIKPRTMRVRTQRNTTGRVIDAERDSD